MHDIITIDMNEKEIFKEYKELFKEQDFKDAIGEKRVCLFLGSGVGFNIGMPDWKGLADKIVRFALAEKAITRSEKLNLLNNNYSPIKIISVCINKLETKGLQDKLNCEFKNIFFDTPKQEYQTSKIYKSLNSLYTSGSTLIVQTNYDVMIEKYQLAEEETSEKSFIPFKSISIPNPNELLQKVVYLHGRFDYSSSEVSTYKDLVLTKTNYNEVYVIKNDPKCINQKNFIEYLMKNFYIIFLGYSLSDIELLQLIVNKPKTESYKDIAVIVDNCRAKQIDNEINSGYLLEASNNKVKTYYYDTEILGIKKGFENMVIELELEIVNYLKDSIPITKYINPQEVDFGS